MTKPGRLDVREPRPPFNQHCSWYRGASDGSQFSHTTAIARDRDLFTGDDAVDDFAAVVAKLADRDICHARIVSPVIPARTTPSQRWRCYTVRSASVGDRRAARVAG